jgi:hypothetical protein
LRKANSHHGTPETITVDKSGANKAGIEIMHMVRKGQLRATGKLRPAQQFYSLAG